MNCAPVNIVPKGSKHSRDAQPETLSPRDTAIINAAAQSALSSYPQLFVANLASVNDCVTKETQDVIFDNPGNTVQYADGKSGSAKPSFGKGQCTGRGNKNAGSSSPSSSSPPPSSPGGSSPGDDGQWKDSSSKQSSSKCPNDGLYRPECYGGGDTQKAISGSSSSPATKAKAIKQAQSQDSVEDIKTGGQPSAEVEKELQDYLSTLYGSAGQSKRTECGSVKRRLETCGYPSRWVKKSLCVWVCVRKGRVTKRATEDLRTILNAEFVRLATKIAELLKLVSQKQSLERRQPYVPSAAVENATAPPSTFDLFLTYLSQLQSTVIECIRGIAATVPVDRTLEAARIAPVEPAVPVEPAMQVEPAIPVEPLPEISPIVPTPDAALLELSQPLPTPEAAALLRGPAPVLSPPVPEPVLDPAFVPATAIPTKLKRQLLVPDASILDWLNTIDPTDLSSDVDINALVKDLQVLGRYIARIVNTLQKPKPPFRHRPPIAVLPPFANATIAALNKTSSNPLQEAADRASFLAALAADDKANTPLSSSSTSSSTPLSTAAAFLPWLMGPGPVVPPGVVIDWPGPNKFDDGDDGEVSNLEHFPIVVNDIDDGEAAREQVRKWFEDLGKGASDPGKKDDDVVST